MAVVTPPNHLLRNSQGRKVSACEYEYCSDGSCSSPCPSESLSVGSFRFMELSYLFFVDFGLVTCRFFPVTMDLKFHSLNYSLEVIP